jgi:hypothetical protein
MEDSNFEINNINGELIVLFESNEINLGVIIQEYLKSFVNKNTVLPHHRKKMKLARTPHHIPLGQKAASQYNRDLRLKLFWPITKISLELLKKRLVSFVFEKNLLKTSRLRVFKILRH